MKSIAQLVVACANLAEAEGRVLRVNVLRIGTALGVVLLATILAAVGLAFILAFVYTLCERGLGEVWAMLLTGLLTLAIAGGMLWIARTRVAT